LQLVLALGLVHLILLKDYQVLENLDQELTLQQAEQLEPLKPKLITLAIMTNLGQQEQLQQVLEVVVVVQPCP
jgi:hypothetical protein